jgi:hypothetical protein
LEAAWAETLAKAKGDRAKAQEHFRQLIAQARKEIDPIASEAWKEAKPHMPNLTTALAFGALAGAFVGPVAATMTFVVSFRPLQRRLSRMLRNLPRGLGDLF